MIELAWTMGVAALLLMFAVIFLGALAARYISELDAGRGGRCSHHADPDTAHWVIVKVGETYA